MDAENPAAPSAEPSGPGERRLDRFVPWAALALLCAFHLFYQLVLCADSFVFEFEHGAFFWNGWRGLSGDVAPRGPPVGPFHHLHHGPMFYWLMALPLSVSADPVWLRFAWVLGSCGAAALLFDALRRHVRWPIALFAVFGLLSSSFSWELCRQLWHSSLLPVFACGVLWACERLLSDGRPRYGVIGTVLGAVAWQLHSQAIVFIPLLLGVALYRRRALGWKVIVACTALFLLVSAPLLAALWAGFADAGVAPIQDRSAVHGIGVADPVLGLGFVLEQMAPVWGRRLAPLLLVPWALLLVTGLVTAARRRRPLAVLLAANVVLGFVLLLPMIHYLEAPRYLHLLAFGWFGIAAFGLDELIGVLATKHGEARRWVELGLGGLGCLVMLDACMSAPPPLVFKPELSPGQQRDIAELVVSVVPEPLEEPARVHGLYFVDATHLLGLDFFHDVAAEKAGETGAGAGVHVLVSPAAPALKPLASEVLWTRSVPGSREVTVTAYIPGIDYDSIDVVGPGGMRILSMHDREAPIVPAGPVTHVVRVPVSIGGAVTVLLRRPDSSGGECPVRADLDGRSLGVLPLDTQRLWAAGYRLLLPGPGRLAIEIGPCDRVPYVDLF